MELLINDTKETFEGWISRDYIPYELKETLSKASILIVPFENLRESTQPLFPVGTEDILSYFKANLPKNELIDICISDADYHEFAFYSDYKREHNLLREIQRFLRFPGT